MALKLFNMGTFAGTTALLVATNACKVFLTEKQSAAVSPENMRCGGTLDVGWIKDGALSSVS